MHADSALRISASDVRRAAGDRFKKAQVILRRGWLADVSRQGHLLTATARGLVGVRVGVDARNLDFACSCGASAFCEHAAALALAFAEPEKEAPREDGLPWGAPAPPAKAGAAAAPAADAAPGGILRAVMEGVLSFTGEDRVTFDAPPGTVFADVVGETLRWFWWRRESPARLEGDARTVARAASLLAEKGVRVETTRSGRSLEGAVAGFHQRTLGEDVYVVVQAPTTPTALELARRLSEAGARPAPGTWPPSLWAVPEAAFAEWWVRARAEGAAVAPDPALNPKPLKGVTVLVDAGALPARLREEGPESEPAIRTPALLKAVEDACRSPVEEDREHGHALVPAAHVVDVEEALRALGADVVYRRLAPAGSRYLAWHDWLPEDAAGARPRLRAPFHGRPTSPVPGLKPHVRLEGYQEEAVGFILHHDHSCLLADDMGLGKTLECIASAQHLPGRVLVVCPASARPVWKNEVEKFTDESAVVLDSRTPDDLDVAQHAAKYVVVSYDALERFAPRIESIRFDLVVLDESHYVKNARTARSRSAREHALRIPRRLVVSGTPVMNTPDEIRAQLAFLHPDEWSDADWFKRRFQDPFEQGSPEVKDRVLAKLKTFLEGVMLRREKSVALPDLPPKTIEWRRVSLVGEAWRAYRAMEDEYRAFVTENGLEVAAAAKGAGKLERLKQAALAGKMPAALAFVRELLDAGEKVVVFSKYRNALASAAKELAAYGPVSITGATSPEHRADAMRRFQEDESCRVFLGQLIAAGTALTLVRGTHCVFLDLDWNPANHRQAMDRIHRKGQTRPVTVHFFLAEGTVDEDVESTLEEKGRMMDALLAAGAEEPPRRRGIEKEARLAVAERILARADAGEHDPGVYWIE